MIQPKAYFPVLITEQIADCRTFFMNHFGFETVFDSDWYVHLVHATGAQLGFLVPDHPSQPQILHGSFSGSGLVYSFEVESVDDAFAKMSDTDVEVLCQPKPCDCSYVYPPLPDRGGVTQPVCSTCSETI